MKLLLSAPLTFAAIFGDPELRAEPLSRDQCRIVDEFGAEELINRFVLMAFRDEGCSDIKGNAITERSCRTGLAKRESPLHLYPVYVYTLSNAEKLDDFQKALEFNAALLNELSGIEISVADEDVDLAERDPGYLKSRGVVFFGTSEDRALLQYALWPETLERRLFVQKTCAAKVYVHGDGEVMFPEYYINAARSRDDLRRCVAEEVYNSLGLFGDPIGSASFIEGFGEDVPLADGEYDVFTPRDKLLLELLYSDRLTIGDDVSSVKTKLKEWIEADCK